jgi:hypothetical protein
MGGQVAVIANQMAAKAAPAHSQMRSAAGLTVRSNMRDSRAM